LLWLTFIRHEVPNEDTLMLMYATYLSDTRKMEDKTEVFDRFFRANQRRAFAMIRLSVSTDADALDIIQQSMERLYVNYKLKSENELKPLFYRILNNALMDFHRKRKAASKLFFWRNYEIEDSSASDEIHAADISSPEDIISAQQSANKVIKAIRQLSIKQKQCYMLRVWESMSVKETASVMQCSEGTVKTHFHRACQLLQQSLKDENLAEPKNAN
jgi:RNA polymerase sigma-70 factor, ECF subfamily